MHEHAPRLRHRVGGEDDRDGDPEDDNTGSKHADQALQGDTSKHQPSRVGFTLSSPGRVIAARIPRERH